MIGARKGALTGKGSGWDYILGGGRDRTTEDEAPRRRIAWPEAAHAQAGARCAGGATVRRGAQGSSVAPVPQT